MEMGKRKRTWPVGRKLKRRRRPHGTFHPERNPSILTRRAPADDNMLTPHTAGDGRGELDLGFAKDSPRRAGRPLRLKELRLKRHCRFRARPGYFRFILHGFIIL